MEGGEKDIFPSPPKGQQTWNLPRAIKHWKLPLATKQNASPLTTKLGTFHWPPSWGFPSPSSFPFFLKV